MQSVILYEVGIITKEFVWIVTKTSATTFRIDNSYETETHLNYLTVPQQRFVMFKCAEGYNIVSIDCIMTRDGNCATVYILT